MSAIKDGTMSVGMTSTQLKTPDEWLATPRTDAEAAKHRVYDWAVNRHIEMQIVPADFARQLERETATLHALIARMKTRAGVNESLILTALDKWAVRNGIKCREVLWSAARDVSAALQSVAKEGDTE